MSIYANGRDTSLRVYGAGPGAGDVGGKLLTLSAPVVGGVEPSFFTENGFNVSRMVGAIRGSGPPSVTWTMRFAATRDAVGTEVLVGGTLTDDLANGSSDVFFSNAQIPANSFVWLEVISVSGSVDELAVTLLPVIPAA